MAVTALLFQLVFNSALSGQCRRHEARSHSSTASTTSLRFISIISHVPFLACRQHTAEACPHFFLPILLQILPFCPGDYNSEQIFVGSCRLARPRQPGRFYPSSCKSYTPSVGSNWLAGLVHPTLAPPLVADSPSLVVAGCPAPAQPIRVSRTS